MDNEKVLVIIGVIVILYAFLQKGSQMKYFCGIRACLGNRQREC